MGGGHLLACPDKFRGTAAGSEVAGAALEGARRAGWAGEAAPLADGGEGLLEAVDGEPRRSLVTGPLGQPVEAEWRLLPDEDGRGPVGVVEMAKASGLLLAGGAEGNDPERATTFGTGELVAAAVAAGARRVVVGCGGSATTDGGTGAVQALAEVDLDGVELLIACDVTTPFLEAARVYGPQKGADAAAIERLSARLVDQADAYRSRYGMDLTGVPGAGAAGGLAGGLLALGGRILSGFDLVADLRQLDQRLQRADAVVTGEGRFDATSLAGKVVGGVLGRVAGRLPVLVVVGSAAAGVTVPPGAQLVALADHYGQTRAFAEPLPLVAEVVAAFLAELGEPA